MDNKGKNLKKIRSVKQIKGIITKYFEAGKYAGNSLFEISIKKRGIKESEVISFIRNLVNEIDVIADIYLAFNKEEAHLIFSLKKVFENVVSVESDVICYTQVLLRKDFESFNYKVSSVENILKLFDFFYKKYSYKNHRYFSCLLKDEDNLVNNFLKNLWLENGDFNKFFIEIESPFQKVANLKLNIIEKDFLEQLMCFYFHFFDLKLVDNLVFKSQGALSWNFLTRIEMFSKNPTFFFEKLKTRFPIQMNNIFILTPAVKTIRLPELIISLSTIKFNDGYFDFLKKKFWHHNSRNDAINCLCYNKTTFNRFLLAYKEKLDWFSDMIRLIKEVIIVKNGIYIIFNQDISHKVEVNFNILDGMDYIGDKPNIKFCNKIMFWDTFVFDFNTNYYFIGDSELLRIFFIKIFSITSGFTFDD